MVLHCRYIHLTFGTAHLSFLELLPIEALITGIYTLLRTCHYQLEAIPIQCTCPKRNGVNESALDSYCGYTENRTTNSIIGLVVEFVVAIDEARVRFTDDALSLFCPFV